MYSLLQNTTNVYKLFRRVAVTYRKDKQIPPLTVHPKPAIHSLFSRPSQSACPPYHIDWNLDTSRTYAGTEDSGEEGLS
ncbi:hypothetical protein B0H12DRAFT_1151432 [Mycena haematopus]|nr:hypothetical protein B0H12DRAFT_1151432 [Mycena haematopus]